jgi:DNA-binding NarL/FixJ family response regulator
MARPTSALIIDDEDHVRMFLRFLLKDIGITQVLEASDGARGLAMALEHQPELLLLDINLPMMNGLDLLKQLSLDRPRIPVIMVTSQSAMKAVLEASKLGAVGYILKHSPKAEALRMLREAVDGLADEDDETAE